MRSEWHCRPELAARGLTRRLGPSNGDFRMILIFGRNAKLPAKWAFLQLTEFTGPLRDPNTASPSQIHAQGHGSISESASASSPLGLKGAT